MTLIVSLYLFVLGLICGSFALALTDRIHTEKDFIKDRSRCDSCKKVLMPVDLIPVLSWLAFRGRCRRCRTQLSIAYPLTELMTGVWFASSFLFWPHELNSILTIAQFGLWLCALTLMASLLIYDLRWLLLPFKIVNPLIGISVVYAAISLLVSDSSFLSGVIQLIFAGVVTYGLFKLMFTLSKGAWIGGGDVRLSIAMALLTGSLLLAWLSVFASSIIGLLISVPVLLKNKNKPNKRKLKIPFGPALLLGLYVAVVFGERFVSWYEQLLVI